ncbi:peroxisomal sarcosine oxidase isoform 4-T4 [Dugong dugon]
MGGLDSASVFYPEKDSVHKSEPHTQLICLSPSLPFQDAVRQLGGILHDGEKVTEIKPGLPVKVKTTSRSYQAKSVVITAGPWTNRLLSTLGIQLPLRTLRINVCYWREKVPGSYGGSQAFPCFLSLGLDLAPHHIYGLPAGEYPGLVKSPSDHGGRQQKHTPLLTVCSARPSDVLSPGKGSPPFEDLTFLNTAANIGSVVGMDSEVTSCGTKQHPSELGKAGMMDGGHCVQTCLGPWLGGFAWKASLTVHTALIGSQVCYHHGNDADPEERDCPSAFSDNQDVQILCRFVRDHLPDLGPTPAIMEHCMYTDTGVIASF